MTGKLGWWNWAFAILIFMVMFWLFFCPLAKADPPHPSKHYKWSTLPTGEVVLHYLENGQHLRFVYRLVNAIEPATPCAPKYGKKTFRLVTWDMTYPYFYTMSNEPVMRWNPKIKEYVRLEE